MKKNIYLSGNNSRNSYFLPLASLIFSVAMLLLLGRAGANNAVLRSIFSCQAQGLGGLIPTIKIWYQQGTNLSFIPSGEVIKKVWLNDPSQVTLDFDGPVCMQFGQEANTNIGDCKNSAANVIQLRRIKKLNIPGLPLTKNTLLTVVTEAQGRNKLYTFRVIYGTDNPEYHTLAIFSDPSGQEGACAKVPR
ncbi:hypothetical protein GNF10_06885 [Nostoc sp. UCD121]|uniref:hypothetical protein n=1 Tax=unclassified Nostoc TaxID=2593658 RepID=UPI001629712A|nr:MULTISPECIES: hypothetical protein [unclassified Nostoc]MBC1223110.1 hypothetical protein [Nostoc sp. UCD120]MBC1275719.1 hypothetical protein [Nostoc sp. UCD121]MBC1297299.1 hypothetical protein [Nostoc sp. UCD122]